MNTFEIDNPCGLQFDVLAILELLLNRADTWAVAVQHCSNI